PPEMADQGPFRGATTMLFSDPPVHERLRRLVSRDFTPRRIRELEPRIRAIAAELLDNVVRKGAFDVMADLPNLLEVMVIAEMLGIPPAHYAHFNELSDVVIGGGNVLPGLPMPLNVVAAGDELRAYFADEIEKRRSRPGPDLISALVTAHDDEVMTA